MPTSIEFATMLVKDRRRVGTLWLIDQVITAALEGAEQDLAYLERTIDCHTAEFGEFEIDVALAIPSPEEMQEFDRVRTLGAIVFDEIHCICNGQRYRTIPSNLPQFHPSMVTSISLVGRYKNQPFVVISADSRDELVSIDFRRSDGFRNC